MEEAQKSLARTRGIPKEEAKGHFIILREVEEIKSSVQYEMQTRGGWIDCFRPQNKTLYRTLLGMTLQSLQQLTGANYFFYYGASVFRTVGLSDSFVTQIILGAVNFVCTFGGMYVLERVSDFIGFSKFWLPFLTFSLLVQFGRRKPLIIGGIWQSAWLFVFAAAGTAVDPTAHTGVGKCKTPPYLHVISLTSHLSDDCGSLHVYLGLCDDLGSVSICTNPAGSSCCE
jgi:hypothetical protein